MNIRNKTLVILGPTATGKSDLAVQIALWIKENKIGNFNGAEIISADSRQVYKGLDIGTGKITAEETCGIKHHCLDIADPKEERFTVMHWKKCAEKVIGEIRSRGNLPIICGGTGFYIKTLLENIEYPEITIDPGEESRLENMATLDLFKELGELDPERASQIDQNNKRRLIRAILIARQLGKVPPIKSNKETARIDSSSSDTNNSRRDPEVCSNTFKIGLILPDPELKERIKTRLIKRIESGMIEEAQRLNEGGLSFEKMEELGLEYRYEAKYLKGEMMKEEMIEILTTRIWQYARRQKTWFKADKEIVWFGPKEIEKIKTVTEDFLINYPSK